MLHQLAKRVRQRRSYYVAVVILVVGIIMSVLVANKVKHEEEKRIQLTLQLRSLLISTTLQRGVNNTLDKLQSVSNLYTVAKDFSDADFQQFFQTEFQEQSAINVLSWAPRVMPDQRAQFEATHRDRFSSIQGIGEQGQLDTATERNEYFPILYTAANTPSDNLIGLDFSTSAIVKKVMKEARDSGRIAATSVIDDSDDNLEQQRLLILVPVYDTPTVPTTIEARRRSLAGYFISELLLFNVVRGAFDSLNMGGIDVYVTEEQENNRLLHVHKKRDGQYVSGSLQELDTTLQTQNIIADTSIEVSGRNWTLFFIPNTRFFESQRTQQWIVVLIAGLISTSLLSLYIKRHGDYAQSTRALMKKLERQNQCLETTLLELKKTQAQVIHTEKLSALGRMVGGIAHEINNPVTFISGNLGYLQGTFGHLLNTISSHQVSVHKEAEERCAQQRAKTLNHDELQFIEEDFPKVMQSMTAGTERIRDIVSALRTFSRVDESGAKIVDLHECLDSTLLILEYRLKAQASRPEITVTKTYHEALPEIECLPGELNQVFIHILGNAIDAFDAAWASAKRKTQSMDAEPLPSSKAFPLSASEDFSPQLFIDTDCATSDTVTIRIRDNGPGMSAETQEKIFEPFFSTKPVGQGTGLGLFICYQIIQQHGGSLSCHSTPGEKTEFLITLSHKI